MKNLLLVVGLFVLVISLAGCRGLGQSVGVALRQQTIKETYSPVSLGGPSNSLQIDAYGLGVHMNRYGQAVRLRPDFGAVPGELLQITPDAYGLGVHMDQYGRPVREYPWP